MEILVLVALVLGLIGVALLISIAFARNAWSIIGVSVLVSILWGGCVALYWPPLAMNEAFNSPPLGTPSLAFRLARTFSIGEVLLLAIAVGRIWWLKRGDYRYDRSKPRRYRM